MKLMLLLTAVAREHLGDVSVKPWPPGLAHRVPFAPQVPGCPLVGATGKKLLA